MMENYRDKIKYAGENVNSRENYGMSNEAGYDNNSVKSEGEFDKYQR